MTETLESSFAMTQERIIDISLYIEHLQTLMSSNKFFKFRFCLHLRTFPRILIWTWDCAFNLKSKRIATIQNAILTGANIYLIKIQEMVIFDVNLHVQTEGVYANYMTRCKGMGGLVWSRLGLSCVQAGWAEVNGVIREGFP